MSSTPRRATALLVMCITLACQAQGVPAAAAAPAASAPRHADASVRHTVIEDDGARIEETRQRGAARRIVVQSKVPGAREYEIQVAPAGRDPAQERGGAGQRAWSLFRF